MSTSFTESIVEDAAPTLLARNYALHQMLVNGVTVEYRRPDDSIAGAQAWDLDFNPPQNNLAVELLQNLLAGENKARRKNKEVGRSTLGDVG